MTQKGLTPVAVWRVSPSAVMGGTAQLINPALVEEDVLICVLLSMVVHSVPVLWDLNYNHQPTPSV